MPPQREKFVRRFVLKTGIYRLWYFAQFDLESVKVFERTTEVYERSCRGVTAELAAIMPSPFISEICFRTKEANKQRKKTPDSG